MLGILIGTVSLFALIATLRRGRYGHRGFRRIVRRLHASPSQEEALRGVADGIFETGRATREDGFAMRSAIRAALEKDELDEGALETALARFDAATARLRETLVGTTRKVHETLDPAQRRKLLSFMSRAPYGYRRHHAC